MIRSWMDHANTAVDWSGLLGYFGNPNIRPSDVDGQVHRTGRLLQLDAKLWAPPLSEPPFPITNMADWTPNLTVLWLAHDPIAWAEHGQECPTCGYVESTHRPTLFTHYYLIPGMWPTTTFTTNKWTELDPDWATHIRAMCTQWDTWTEATKTRWAALMRHARADMLEEVGH